MKVHWDVPDTVDEALRLRASHQDGLVVAGGTFVGVLMSTGLLEPEHVISLHRLDMLRSIDVDDDRLVIGALASHTEIARDPAVRSGWPALARAFEVVASARIRNQATIGGVLADADYASDPPAMLVALDGTVWLQSESSGLRAVPAEDFVQGHYTTALAEDELVTHVSVPRTESSMSYWKFRTRSSEDRPCVGVALSATISEGLLSTVRVAVGAVADRPVFYPDVCAEAVGMPVGQAARLLADAYADRTDPLSDQRGSADYRRRVLAIGIRRGLEAMAA